LQNHSQRSWIKKGGGGQLLQKRKKARGVGEGRAKNDTVRYMFKSVGKNSHGD